MKAVVGVRTDVGRVREGNEDAYIVEEPIFAVADGMGGHLAGDVASRTAIDTIRDDSASMRDGASLERVIKEANSAIWSRSQSEASLRGMGTTCTLILLDGSEVHIGHVGDSRAYLFHDGELTQLTEDHTLVGRMVKEGRLQPEEAEHHPQRSIITRALGVDQEVQVDLRTVDVVSGDRILICSDGLTSMVDGGTISAVLEEESDPQDAAERLVDLANDAGGEDNITVVVMAFANDGMAAPAPVEAREASPGDRSSDGGPSGSTAPVAETAVREEPEPAVPETGARLEPEPRPEPVISRARSGGRALRALIGSLLIVAIVLVGGFVVFRYVIVPNSYFVGVNADGRVTIYQGLREDVAGVTFKEEQDVTTIALSDLPAFLRADVREGIEVDSLADARRTVANLERRARDEEFDRARDRRGETKKERSN